MDTNVENRIQKLGIIRADIVLKHQVIKLLIEADGKPISELTSELRRLLMRDDSPQCRLALIAWCYNELKRLNSAYMEALNGVGNFSFISTTSPSSS